MFGVDRAEVWVRVDADVELIALGIQKKFPGVASSGKPCILLLHRDITRQHNP